MSEFKAVILTIISTVFFAIMPVIIKVVPGNIDGYFVSLIRFLVGVPLIIIAMKMYKIPFRINDKKSFVLRGVFGSIGMILYYVSISITSSGRATVLNSTFPVFTGVFAYLFFKQRTVFIDILGLILCLIGTFFIINDGSRYLNYGDVIGFLSGVIGGVAFFYAKKSREKDSAFITYLSVCLFGTLFNLGSIPKIASIDLVQASLLVLAALLSFFGQILAMVALKYINAVKSGIIIYLTIPLTVFFSYFIKEEFKLKFFIGTAFVVAGLLLSILKNKNIYKRKIYNT